MRQVWGAEGEVTVQVSGQRHRFGWARRIAGLTLAAAVLAACGQGVRSTGAAPSDSTPATEAQPGAAVTCADADAATQTRVGQGVGAGWTVVEAATARGEGDAVAVVVRARKPDNFGAFVYAEGVLVADAADGALQPVGDARFWKAGDAIEAPSWLTEAARKQLLDCVG